MHRISVNSSNIVSIGYDLNDNTLEIEFTGGTKYQYHKVTHIDFIKLITAESHGVTFAEIIKNVYKCQKMVPLGPNFFGDK